MVRKMPVNGMAVLSAVLAHWREEYAVPECQVAQAEWLEQRWQWRLCYGVVCVRLRCALVSISRHAVLAAGPICSASESTFIISVTSWSRRSIPSSPS